MTWAEWAARRSRLGLPQPLAREGEGFEARFPVQVGPATVASAALLDGLGRKLCPLNLSRGVQVLFPSDQAVVRLPSLRPLLDFDA